MPIMLPKELETKIWKEYSRACIKHPSWPTTDFIHAAAIVCDETGELLKAAIRYQRDGGPKEAMEKEAIQSAAMLFRFLANF